MRRPLASAKLGGAALALVLVLGIGDGAAGPPLTVAGPLPVAGLSATTTPAQLPPPAGRFAPSRLSAAADVTGATLLGDEAACGGCHQAALVQWRTSAHAFASLNNPAYRASLDAFRRAKGPHASRLCGGCHDPAMLLDGLLDAPHLDASDPRAQVGISCRVCHGAEPTAADGNGSLHLGARAFEPPVLDDTNSVAAHRESMAGSALRSEALCGSCHRSFLSRASGHARFIPGADDYGDWLGSAHAGSRLDRIDTQGQGAERGCRHCHMPDEPASDGDMASANGKLHSHRFVGGHSWLASQRNDAEQLQRVQTMLRSAVTLDAVLVDAKGRVLHGHDALANAAAIDVVITNTGVGHRFPGGTRDAADVWLEVEIYDAAGRSLASAGVARSPDDAKPRGRHVLRAAMLNEQAQLVAPRAIEQFAALAYDHTIAPGDSEVARYALTDPAGHPMAAMAAFEVRLRHRARAGAVQRLACADQTARRGIDACKPQPITLLAQARFDVAAPTPQQLLRHGRAWLHGLDEEVELARDSLLRARAGWQEPRSRAATDVELARLASRLGRTAELERRLSLAAAAAPGEPAIAWLHGRHLQSVWRSAEAVPWLLAAAQAAPRDPRGWRQLAIARGSAGHAAAALDAAARGLRLAPRDADLLRSQWLNQPDQAAAAAAAFTSHASGGEAARLGVACATADPLCARLRQPVQRFLLRPRGQATTGRR